MTILFRSLLSVRVFRDTFWGIRQHEQKNRAICRDANDYLWLDSSRTDNSTRNEASTRNCRFWRVPKRDNAFQRKLRIDNGIISESSILDHTKDTWKKMFARDVCGTEIHRNHTDLNIRKARKKKKRKRKNINTRQTLNILLIVDHNFTTIFRQPDGSAG